MSASDARALTRRRGAEPPGRDARGAAAALEPRDHHREAAADRVVRSAESSTRLPTRPSCASCASGSACRCGSSRSRIPRRATTCATGLRIARAATRNSSRPRAARAATALARRAAPGQPARRPRSARGLCDGSQRVSARTWPRRPRDLARADSIGAVERCRLEAVSGKMSD
jgi:hypothetical protein